MKTDYQAPCIECGGRCCKYVAIEIEDPSNKENIDHIRWYLMHKDVYVFKENNKNWYVEFRTPCEALEKDMKCGIYKTRPKICMNHGNEDGSCEYFDSPYLEYFKTAKEFEDYLDKKGKKWLYKFQKKK